jgi:16S rRNA (cytidine1402-2'-O)-methyltransferase
MSEKGLLYLVATPIGNLQDLSGRMKDAFSDCDLIACEDTRITRKILAHLDVHKPLISYREENERKQSKFLSLEISNGKKIVLVSDAGYPGISDPGFSIVRECRSQGLKIIPIPGPNAGHYRTCSFRSAHAQFSFSWISS